MIALPVAEVAAMLGADLAGPGDPAARVTSVTADSRNIAPGALFVALPGARTDGHDFVATAYAAGAAAALTQRPIPDALCLVVADPLVALGRLARHLVDRASPGGLRVVGITGSQGKTSTKDLLSQVLETVGPTVAPAGNLNNELGVPLTVTRIDEQTRYLVAEMGARGIGHIAYLCDIAPPTVGVVLNVGHAHVGEFGGQAAIAQAKGELVEALPADGVAVLNAADPLVWAMRERTAASVLGVLRRWTRRSGRASGPPTWSATPPAATPSGCTPPACRRRRRPARSRFGCRSRAGTRSATRWPRPPRPWLSGSTSPRWRPVCPAPPRARGGGWSCTSAATASPSSTTRTTPTRTRWPLRSARWPS